MNNKEALAKFPNHTLYFIEDTQMYVTVRVLPTGAVKEVDYYTKDLKHINRLHRSDIYFLIGREKWVEVNAEKVMLDDIRDISKDTNVEFKTTTQVPPCSNFHKANSRTLEPASTIIVLDYLSQIEANSSLPNSGRKSSRHDK